MVCVKAPGPDVLLEARGGGAFLGTPSPATVEATVGFGNVGLGLPRNIQLIADFGFNGGAQVADEAEVTINTIDISAGVRAYWPTRGRFSPFADVLFGVANHWLDLEPNQEATSGKNDIWSVMGQLAIGAELHLFGGLYFVARAEATFLGAEGAMLAAVIANGDPQSVAYAGAALEHEVAPLRLAVTAGPSLAF